MRRISTPPQVLNLPMGRFPRNPPLPTPPRYGSATAAAHANADWEPEPEPLDEQGRLTEEAYHRLQLLESEDPDDCDWDWAVFLTSESADELQLFRDRISALLGNASLRALHIKAYRTLLWAEAKHRPERGPYGPFAQRALESLYRRFRKQVTPRNLKREQKDEREREIASASEAGLIRYLKKARGRIARMQMAYPTRWHVANLAREDVIDRLEVLLLEQVRGLGRLPWVEYEAPGAEATFKFLDRARRRLKNKNRIYEVPTDTSTLRRWDASRRWDEHFPSPEEVAIHFDKQRKMERVIEAPEGLTRRQRQYLWAYKNMSRQNPNADARQLSGSVSDMMMKDRSSVKRMRDAIAKRLRRQVADLLDE